MDDEKTKKVRSWARTVLKKAKENPNHFDNGVVDAAEFILKETKHPIPEGSLLFREAESEGYGKVTVISEKPVIGLNDSRYVYTLQLDETLDSGVVYSWYNIEDLDFYPDVKRNIKTRRDFHSLKTGVAIRSFLPSGGRPVSAVKVSIDRWEITGYTISFTDQEMEDFGYEWEVI